MRVESAPGGRWPDAIVGLLAGKRNGIIVLDIDLKNDRDGLASLRSLGFDLDLSPVRTRTPSGGWHVFFAFDPRLKNSASKIASGLDVRTTGGFVVAPGVFRDGDQYFPEGAPLGSVILPAFPEALIPPPEPEHEPAEIIVSPTHAQIAWAVDQLDDLAAELAATPEGSREVTLNDAIYWAGGAAANGLITEEQVRSTLGAAAEACGLSTREFEAKFKRRGAWEKGLLHPLANVPPPSVDADEAMDEDPDSDPLDPLGAAGSTPSAAKRIDPVTARLNQRHAIVAHNGRTLVATELVNGAIGFGTVTDLDTLYANDRVRTPTGRTEPASKRWLRDPSRRTYFGGVLFAPGGARPDVLNLWRGWAVEPNAGASCDLFLRHVRNVVCRGNEEHFAYAIGWMAHMVQRPEEKPGVALVLKGAKGAGKDTVADYLACMMGRHHAPTVAERDQVVGKFNRRLETALLFHVQEGSWAGDRSAEGNLKYLVTSDWIEIERKGIDSINLPSVLRLFISANAEWVVPTSPDERRWAVFNVSDARRGDDAYFSALRAEMNGQGPAALLHYLQNYDLSGFNVRQVPETEGLLDQKIASLRNVEKWWFDVLTRGELPVGIGSFDDAEPSWVEQTATIGRDELRGHYVAWLRDRRFDGDALDCAQFGRRMREMLPRLGTKQPRLGSLRVRQYVVPPLQECRSSFDGWIGGAVAWEAME